MRTVFRFVWIVMLLTLVAVGLAQDTNIVREIIVRGNNVVRRDAILSLMTTKVGSTYSEERLETDQQAIYGLGFFSAVDVRPVSVENGWQVVVSVQEYPKIKEIRIAGNTVVKTSEILAVISPGLQPGNVFNNREQAQTVRAIEKLYSDKGYAANVFQIEPLADSPGTLNIQILEQRVGTITVQGNRLTKDWVLRRLIKTRSGDVFSRTKFGNDIRRLGNTQWFETVVPSFTPGQEPGQVDLALDLREARTGTFNVGLQLDPRSALAGILRYSQANVGGTGQSYDVNFLQATQGGGPSVDLSYTNPFFDARDTSLRVSLFSRLVYRFQNNLFGSGTSFTNGQNYQERRTGFSVGLSRPVNDYVNAGASFRFENVKTQNLKDFKDNGGTPNDPTDDEPINNFIQQDGDVAVFTFGGSRDRRDIAINPAKGDFAQLSIEPGYSNITRVGGLSLAQNQNILGSNFFVRNTIEYRAYYTDQGPRGLDLKAPRRVLALRARYGTIVGNVPFWEQFFAGGVDTIRGYNQDRFWGRNTLITSAELRYPIESNLSLVGFVDYGGAWGGYGTVNNYTQSDKFNLHLGFGPGISFNVGALGNIQLYLGFDENGRSRTHFLIGNSF